MQHVQRSVTIKRSRQDVYQSWRNFELLPAFMIHLVSVKHVDERRSHWVANGPAGTKIEWTAEITTDQPGEVLAWQSVADADVKNGGEVRFVDAPGDRGTELHVDLFYDLSGASATVAQLFGEEPGQQLRDDLRRFKQVMETGEVVLSDGSLEGAGQGASKQRVAQPVGTRGSAEETEVRS